MLWSKEAAQWEQALLQVGRLHDGCLAAVSYHKWRVRSLSFFLP
jgi:hypothetical protein